MSFLVKMQKNPFSQTEAFVLVPAQKRFCFRFNLQMPQVKCGFHAHLWRTSKQAQTLNRMKPGECNAGLSLFFCYKKTSELFLF